MPARFKIEKTEVILKLDSDEGGDRMSAVVMAMTALTAAQVSYRTLNSLVVFVVLMAFSGMMSGGIQLGTAAVLIFFSMLLWSVERWALEVRTEAGWEALKKFEENGGTVTKDPK